MTRKGVLGLIHLVDGLVGMNQEKSERAEVEFKYARELLQKELEGMDCNFQNRCELGVYKIYCKKCKCITKVDYEFAQQFYRDFDGEMIDICPNCYVGSGKTKYE